jgi:hypothetical protein
MSVEIEVLPWSQCGPPSIQVSLEPGDYRNTLMTTTCDVTACTGDDLRKLASEADARYAEWIKYQLENFGEVKG